MAVSSIRLVALRTITVMICGLTAACQTATLSPDPQVMAAVERFYRVYNEHDPSLWNEAVSPAYTGHVNGQTIKSRDEGIVFVKAFLTAFPDLHITLDDTLVTGDKVTTRWSATGTHAGDWSGLAPTQKKGTMVGITIFRVENGQIAEVWNVWDQAGLRQQLTAPK